MMNIPSILPLHDRVKIQSWGDGDLNHSGGLLAMFLGLEKFSVSGLDLVAPKPARW